MLCFACQAHCSSIILRTVSIRNSMSSFCESLLLNAPSTLGSLPKIEKLSAQHICSAFWDSLLQQFDTLIARLEIDISLRIPSV